MAMATSMLLQATRGAVAELPVASVHRNEMYTMLQAPSIGGVRRFGAGRRGLGACRRKAVLIGFRAQNGRFTFPGTRKVKKGASEEIEPDVRMGTRMIGKLPGTLKLGKGKKDNKVVFVAGATGKVGSRVVRELLESGFQVRAGVRNIAKGQALLEMLDETISSDDEPKSWAAKLFKPRTPSKRERVELVECDLEKEDEIENSLGNAGVVVCAIGASEKEVLDVKGPYRIDYKATVNLVKAATNAKVNHFILVSSLGTTKLGWPASVLNLFWGVLVWKAKAEKALEESGLPYTIVRPGGMERPTDAYKETHNLVLAPKDTYSGGQVSSLQVAELIGTCVSNLDLARYKVLEVIAETTAPLQPIECLLAEVPAVTEEDDGETASIELEPVTTAVRKEVRFSSQQEEKSRKAALAGEKKEKDLQAKSRKAAKAEEKKQKDLEEKSRKAAEAEAMKKKELQARYERDLLAAREDEEEAKRKADEALSLKEQLAKRTADLQIQARTAAREVRKTKALENAVVAAARQGRRLSEEEKRAVLEAAAAEFDGEPKTRVDIEKVPGEEIKTPVASTSSKLEKGLKFKALQAAKLKEADDRAAKKFAEKDRLAQQAQAEAESKAQAEINRVAQEENEAKFKAEAKAKAQAQAEKDRVTQEEKEVKGKAEVEAKAQAQKDRVTQEENEAKAKEDAEAFAQSKEDDIAEVEDAKDDEVTVTAQGPAFRWPWQKDERKGVASESFAENRSAKQNEDLSLKTVSEPTSAASDEALFESPELEPSASDPPEFETPPLPTVSVNDEVSNFVEEVVEDTEDVVEKARKAKENAATRAAIALQKARGAASGSFRWPWKKESSKNDVVSETSAVNEGLKENEDAPSQADSELESSSAPLEDLECEATTGKSEDVIKEPTKIINGVATGVAEIAENAEEGIENALSATSDEAVLEPPDLETSPPPSIQALPSAIEEEVSKIAEEIVDERENMVGIARKAKEDAATRAAIALEKARRTASGSFRWPWQKESTENGVVSETSAVSESLEEKEIASPEADLEPETSSTPLEEPDSEGTTEKFGDMKEQPLNVINGIATTVAENTGEVPDSGVVTSEVLPEGSLPKPEGENYSAPVSSEEASEPQSAASDDALLESPNSETSPPPPVPAIEEEVSKFAEEVVEDTEDMVKKARKGKEEAATRAAIALEKAKGAAAGSFKWPWQE